ncbi:MAG: CBS domain-containing protein [Polyangiaceae bacterium]
MKLREVLHGAPVTALPSEAAGVAWERMITQRVDHLVVVHGGRVVGVISRSDLRGPAGGRSRRMGRTVGDLMQSSVVTATPATSVRRAVALMGRHRVGSLPIVERGKLVGIVTVWDMLALLQRQLDAR